MDLFGYHRIVPLVGFNKPTNDPGEAPRVVFPSPYQLVINEEYQRSLSKRALKHIAQMAENFDWKVYTPIVVAETDIEGIYEVIDGQRTAIAAITNGKVAILPALLSTTKNLEDKAKSFSLINNSRIPLSKGDLYFAELAAKDETSISVECALNEAGARLLSVPPSKNIFSVGDTMAIGALKSIVGRSKQSRLVRILKIAIGGEAAPISANLIKAIDLVLPYGVELPELDAKLTRHLKNQGCDRLEALAKNLTPPGKRTFETLADRLADSVGVSKRGNSTPEGRKK